MSSLQRTPTFDLTAATQLLQRHYGREGTLSPLPSERDQNYAVDCDGERFVLKIANAAEDPSFIAAQNEAIVRAATRPALRAGPQLIDAIDGNDTVAVDGSDGSCHRVRLMRFVPGIAMAQLQAPNSALWQQLGRWLGQLDDALTGLDAPVLHRPFPWRLEEGLEVVQRYAPLIADAEHRRDVQELVRRADVATAASRATLRRGAIHNDANDHNVIVTPGSDADDPEIVGVIDFGDMVVSWVVAEVAIAAAYAMLSAPEPLDALAGIVSGFDETYPLRRDELDAVYGLACLRLGVSAAMAAQQRTQRPDDPYLEISQGPIAATVPKLLQRPMALGRQVALDAASGGWEPSESRSTAWVAAQRRRQTGKSLSVGYRRPLHLQRGFMQYLYDTEGRRYLDAYNNVPHVGHCHPRVVDAAVSQQRRLNTNTRYLYDALPRYTERLVATLPSSLQVCFILNSATEANELALRLARTMTGQRDTIVLDAAYHGHTTSLIDISPYKHGGPGGQGAPSWVSVAALPDLFRGQHRAADPQAAARYAASVGECLDTIAAAGRGPAAFIAETCPSVGGQIVLPPGYLPDVYRRVRAAGGVCIADEVQTGFGRLGDCTYAFQEHGVTPDIVVLGKPIGNGHPLAAVVTTLEIADAFANGMEFFSTFGGNPVSCEVGLAVLDVLRDEALADSAVRVGSTLRLGLQALSQHDAGLADVRGRGLFLGAELVRDRESLRPDAARAAAVSNAMRDAGVLIGVDGPDHNVLKIRPPMQFDDHDAEHLLDVLHDALAAHPTA